MLMLAHFALESIPHFFRATFPIKKTLDRLEGRSGSP